jgi:alkanesulfonate monooxygenase SsuD/methylene tetrahydromethanopterin reductase-like flavin-dependent oxidoreductase (luciferase family)
VIRRLLDGEALDFAGAHYRIAAHRLFPLPVQRPLPLLVGGNARGVLELAARQASIVGFTGFFLSQGGRAPRLTHFSADGLADRLAIVRRAAGERFAELELNALVQAVVPGDDPRKAVESVLPRVPGVAVEDLLESPFLLLGSPAHMADALLARRERFGLSYVVVFEPAMDAVGAVIARLRGALAGR